MIRMLSAVLFFEKILKKFLWMILFWVLDNNVVVNYTLYYLIVIFRLSYAKGAYYGRSETDGVLYRW